jgi:hypothetical protein
LASAAYVIGNPVAVQVSRTCARGSKAVINTRSFNGLKNREVGTVDDQELARIGSNGTVQAIDTNQEFFDTVTRDI